MAPAGSKKELTEKIRCQAVELGFQKVGFADALSSHRDEVRLVEWLALGYHATMGWMFNRKNERGDLQEYFPGEWAASRRASPFCALGARRYRDSLQ